MKPGITILFLLALTGCGHSPSLSTSPRQGPGNFFVATDGSDSWSGSSPEQHGTTGPFRSMQRALQASLAFRKTNTVPAAAISIWVRGGLYFLNSPLSLTAADSGLTISAFPGESPILSGGSKIDGWHLGTLNGRAVWTADVPGARDGHWNFRELWVNGRRAVRAREPNSGYFTVERVPDATADGPWMKGQSGFVWKNGDLKPWAHLDDAEVVVMNRWVESRLPVSSLDSSKRLVSLSKRSVFKLDAGDPWYIEGAPEFLDSPGEWCLDHRAGRIYYMPLPGQDLSSVEAIAPEIESLLTLHGKPETGQFITNVTFRGLTFSHSEWQIPESTQAARSVLTNFPGPLNEVGGFGQAAVGVPAAVRADGIIGCSFDNCKFIHLGSYGLELARGCRSNLISHCEFADLGAGGIKIGETEMRGDPASKTSNNEVSDCAIHNGGRMFHSAVGVWIGQSGSNVLSHDLIHDFYYTGISIGWTWGYWQSFAGGNRVEFNHIHHIGILSNGDGPILSDMGGIYTLGRQPGTRILNNLWHDIAGRSYGGWGIYFDEGSSGILAESNVVYRTTHGGFHQHYGETNRLQNNVFAYGRDWQLQRTRDENRIAFIFTNNLVLFDHGVLLGGNWASNHFVMDGNLYWDSRAVADPNKMLFAGQSFDTWQSQGHDTHSLIEDPLVIGLTNGIFELQPGSPVLKLGFEPPDIREVGPRGKFVETLVE